MRKYIAIILIFLLLVLVLYCHFFRRGPGDGIVGPGYTNYPDTVNHWISWNLLFTPSSLKSSTGVIQDFENYLTDTLKKGNPDATITFHLLSCPCDTLLTNLDATVIYGSGNTVPPPPTKPNPGPSGDYTLGNNFETSIPDYPDSTNYNKTFIFIDTTKSLALPPSSPFHRTLAVIDTGLDTLTYQHSYPNTVWSGNLLWQDATKPTLFDVVIGEPTVGLMDHNSVKHGTAVTAIALAQIKQMKPGRIPQIMSIRAFDDSERGSIYTVSCALSYAIQKQADFINASWGYFGQGDSVLKYYLLKASQKSIRIIAAAGNTPGHHVHDSICNTHANNLNSLDRLKNADSLFYPACLAPVIPNLVSVTQFNLDTSKPQKIIPCFYQNYSSNYITVGVLQNTPPNSTCCIFTVPFLSRPLDGSSFATPVMTGYIMSSILDKRNDVKQFIKDRAIHSPDQYTDHGDYFIFRQQ